MTSVTDSYPRLLARTMNFRLGIPRGFAVSPDGARVVFLRAASGVSRAHGLWVYDVATRTERLVADPAALLGDGGEALTVAEQVRRERLRVTSSGVVAFSTDREVTMAAFALSSELFVVPLDGSGPPRRLGTSAPVIDPQLDPSGRRVAYAGDRALRVVDLESGADDVVVAPGPGDPEEVVWGLAEFIAGEELDRGRGFWWSPDGERLLVERYDETPVAVWHISDPAHPEQEPRRVRYPQAGTANAIVGLALVGPGGGAGGRRLALGRSPRRARPRVPRAGGVEWSRPDPRRGRPGTSGGSSTARLSAGTGKTTLLRAVTDDAWVELLPGTPRRLPDGRLLHSVDVGEERRVWIDDRPVTPTDVLVRSVEGGRR